MFPLGQEPGLKSVAKAIGKPASIILRAGGKGNPKKKAAPGKTVAMVFDVFNIEELEQYNSPSFGERVMIKGYDALDKGKTILEVSFRGHKKRVIFNRETRSVEKI